MITTSGLLALIVQLVVAGLIFWLLYWFIGKVGLPEPFNKVAVVIVSLVVVIFLIDVLLNLSAGTPPTHWRWK